MITKELNTLWCWPL